MFTAGGGSGSYEYSIDRVNYQSSNTFNNLSVGIYLLSVRDSAGCVTNGSANLTKSDPSATFSTTSVSCNGGSDGTITVSNPTGGNGGGTFSNYDVMLGLSSWTSFSSTSKLFSGLSSGIYNISLRDQLSCVESYSVTVSQPTANTSTITSYVSGSNGSITVTSSGGTWNKTYRLYNDTTSPYTVGGGSLVATISNVTSGNPSQTFNNLIEGYYYVVVTDANGCTSSTIIQSTFKVKDIGDPVPTNCNCVEVGVETDRLTDGSGQDLYYINNDCELGETSINLNSQLAMGDQVSTFFYFCSKPTLSNMFKYGPNGDAFIPNFAGVTSTDQSCDNNFDCQQM